MNKKYWLYIASHVYCSIKNGQVLLYNTKNGMYIENNTREIVALMQELHKKQNLGVTMIKDEQIMIAPYKLFVEEFCRKDMGGLIDYTQEKPIQLMPILSLQRDIEKLKKDKERYIGEGLLHYLLEINIYVNDICKAQCPLCTTYFKQSTCCTANNGQQLELDRSLLQKILTQIQDAPIGKLNILGGDISQYTHYDKLASMLQSVNAQTHLWLNYLNTKNTEIPPRSFKYIIPVCFPIKESIFASCIKQLNKEKASYHFFITCEDDYNQTTDLLDTYKISDYKLFPIFTGKNSCFFEEQIYMTKQDLFSSPLSFRKIFAHQKLNANFFGSLTILPNGQVYANINSPALGNIKTDNLLDLINKEISDNTAWRKIRNEEPCNDCLYQYLCPPPSNYETIIGKPNLCHVHP